MTVKIQGAENIIDMIIATLQNDMPAKVSAINTEKGDSLISAPSSKDYILDEFAPDRIQRDSDKFLFFPINSSRSVQQFGEVGPMVYQIGCVIVAYAAMSPEKSYRRALRLERAFKEILFESTQTRENSLICDSNDPEIIDVIWARSDTKPERRKVNNRMETQIYNLIIVQTNEGN